MISFLRRYVLHNFALKLISVAAAVLLWMAVARQPIAEIAVTVPIEFTNMPNDLEISSENIPQAQIRVRGPGPQLRSIGQSEARAVLDLAGARPGERTYDLSGRIHVPRDVEVVQVVPTELRLIFDLRASKQVAVHPRVIGTFAAGYHIARIIADPSAVTIIGPKSHVEDIDTALTDPVDATGVVGQATFTTHVYVPDPLVRVARSGALRVTVVTEKSGSKTSGPMDLQAK